MRTIWAIIPVKQLHQAKQRLSPLLNVEERKRLGLAMLQDVLSALGRTRGLNGILLVSGDSEACELGRKFATRILPEAASDGLNPAVTRAARLLAQEGVDGVLVLHGDVPLADPAEIETLIAALGPAPAVVIAPDLARQGTNVMAVSPPGLIPFRYGVNSFTAHYQEAADCSAAPRTLHLPSLAFDIDEPEDLLALAARPGKSLTQILLRELDLESRTHSTVTSVR